MTLIKSRELRPEYKILKSINCSPRECTIYDRPLTIQEWTQLIITPASKSDVVALDIETTGLDPYLDNMVGLGLAYRSAAVYINVSVQNTEVMRQIWELIIKLPLIGHNVMFDGRWLASIVGDYRVNWIGDTYGAAKHLASEGYDNQSWGLKDLQLSQLGWEVKGDEELAEWLIANGHTKTGGKADKSRMHLAPVSILGKYCALDADSTYQLWTRVYAPVFKEHPAYLRYHREEYMTLVNLLIAQQNGGMLIDRTSLQSLKNSLSEDAEKYRIEFLNLQVIKEYQEEFKLKAARKKWDKGSPEVWTKSGKISKVYVNWVNSISKVYREAEMNINSGVQLRELFYNRLYTASKHVPDQGKTTYTVTTERGKVTLEATSSGAPPVSSGALKWFGEPGRVIANYNLEVSERTGRAYPGWRVPGTLTGRLSGSEPNLQQIPKHEGFLRCLIPDDGYTLIDADFAALENVIMAEYSRDKNLLKLYGPTAKPNDGYLFFGSMLPVIGPRIRSAGYDPDNPTPEGIARAKKEAKKERGIAKVLVLSDAYGAGPATKHRKLLEDGVNISLEEVTNMHRTQMELLQGVQTLRNDLMTEWRRNRGYIINGFGRPTAVADKYTKDLSNRLIQSTGHDCTMRWIYFINRLIRERKIDAKPFIVDLHDQSIWQVRTDQVQVMAQVMQDACQFLNKELLSAGWICTLKVEGASGSSMADIKGG
jgi:DNA polymerase I-like protein with 3'-5' exonuclease and polymerase domains